VTSRVDADARGKHDWVHGLMFLGVAEPDGKDRLTIRYLDEVVPNEKRAPREALIECGAKSQPWTPDKRR